MPESLTLYEDRDGIAFLTLNNPRRRNALSLAMMDEMLDHLRDAGDDDDVRVVVIRAEGPVFSSGHDLRELAEGDIEDQTILFARCTTLMESIRLLPKPVIAQAQGLATAAGCQLVATCDLASSLRGCRFRHSGSGHRPVLHHPGRRAGPRRAAQANYGDAADRTAHLGGRSAQRLAWSTASFRRTGWTKRHSRWLRRSRPRRPAPSQSASPPSTARWRWTGRRLMNWRNG